MKRFGLRPEIVAFPGPEVIKHSSCATQLSMEFHLLVETKMIKNKDCSWFLTLTCCIYPADKCLNVHIRLHFNIYEQDKFHAQLS